MSALGLLVRIFPANANVRPVMNIRHPKLELFPSNLSFYRISLSFSLASSIILFPLSAISFLSNHLHLFLSFTLSFTLSFLLLLSSNQKMWPFLSEILSLRLFHNHKGLYCPCLSVVVTILTFSLLNIISLFVSLRLFRVLSFVFLDSFSEPPSVVPLLWSSVNVSPICSWRRPKSSTSEKPNPEV